MSIFKRLFGFSIERQVLKALRQKVASLQTVLDNDLANLKEKFYADRAALHEKAVQDAINIIK